MSGDRFLHDYLRWRFRQNVTLKNTVARRANSGDVQLIWEKVKVNNLPKEDPILRNFNNSRKAIRVSWKNKGKTYSNYYTPESILGLMGVSTYRGNPITKPVKNGLLKRVQHLPMYAPMFRNPVTRNTVFRKNVKFVIMEKRINSRANITSKMKSLKKRFKLSNLKNTKQNKVKTAKNIAATKIQAAFRGGRERTKRKNNQAYDF